MRERTKDKISVSCRKMVPVKLLILGAQNTGKTGKVKIKKLAKPK